MDTQSTEAATDMPLYTGTKTIRARPLSRGDYNDYRGWKPPKGEDQSEPGYLVEYTDGGKPNDDRHEGYISWSPADVFERAYMRNPDRFDFGEAVRRLRIGHPVSRAGWNGKGMFLYYVPENTYDAQTKVAQQHFGKSVPYRGYIAMKTAQGDVVPWVASQSDVLADDWIEGPNEELAELSA